jgi:glucans biosynthesis protein
MQASSRSCVRVAQIALAALVLALPGVERARAFGLGDVAERAAELAARSYQDPRDPVPQWLLDLDYDQYRDIRFRPEKALWDDLGLPFTVQLFHPGFYHNRTVSIHVVTPSGKVSRLSFSPDQFDYGENKAGKRTGKGLGYAGFRVHYPIKTSSYRDEAIAFLGASYFRAVGRDQVYGLSARGIAIDTAMPSREEFPWFREFWLVQPPPGAQELTLYGLLDSPSLTGAYQFVLAPGPHTRLDVEMRLFPRTAIAKLGVAPLTSMFLCGEIGAGEGVVDYRPEVHDSDGLLVATSGGEWLWRPLENPRELSVTSFELVDPRGFGLLQRDRDFDHYQDFEARSDLRPSAWVQTTGAWGAGRVELVEIPTRREIDDNIVAYWVPEATASAETPVSLAYSIFWYGDDQSWPPGGRAVATRRDLGTEEGARRLVVDFDGGALRSLPTDAAVEGVVTAVGSGGEAARSLGPVEVLERQVMRNPITGGWRLVFQLEPAGPVELRAFLRHGDAVLTETWSYLLVP